MYLFGEIKYVVKGITLNYEKSNILNFDVIKKMIVDSENIPIELFNNSMRRTDSADVYTTRVKKTYQIKYTKRQLIGSTYDTIPYRY